MKNKILLGFLSLALVVGIAACDNGNADFSVVDIDPTVELGAMSGLVEGESFSITITLGDGAEGSSVSSLASATWNITDAGGAQVANGTLAPTGDNWTGTITANGLLEGDHTLTVTAVDSNGNSGTSSTTFSIVGAVPDITGSWTLAPLDGALRVGPTAGSFQWFSTPASDATGARACQFDDVWTFNNDGTFSIAMGGNTWLETWQPGGGNACGAPVAPYVDGSFNYSFDGATLTVNGQGAFIGLPKVTNTGELGNQLGATDYPASVTYEVFAVSDTDMELRVAFDNGGINWTFLLRKQ
ncbi:hypothetical protein [Roseivirga misakiensis]|uniref:PKD domain-containing protein n=1 Tax=Roseivirga misakiensis TaxID=1563681 RepID=A0A1E5T0A7_9BACT|nr:hypothetical protein [Roseivirga misakiensis]OEK04810.1 hypothetical protein BFP71_15320 [Roseivirga misakiensis]